MTLERRQVSSFPKTPKIKIMLMKFRRNFERVNKCGSTDAKISIPQLHIAPYNIPESALILYN